MPKNRSVPPVGHKFVEVEDTRTGGRYKVREDVVNPKKHRRVDASPKRKRASKAPERTAYGLSTAVEGERLTSSYAHQTPAPGAEDNESGSKPADQKENS